MRTFLKRLKIILYRLIHFPIVDIFIREHPFLLLQLCYDRNFWRLRESCIRKPTPRKELLYYSFLRLYGSYIGLGATFDERPVFPHSFIGIFISTQAHIGKNVVIFQQVTIGSNTTVGSKNQGSPTIGDNVYIGAGAKIIGNCKIGNNCRIGANCIVTKDVPDNCVCVNRGMEIIQKDEELDNTFVAVSQNKT